VYRLLFSALLILVCMNCSKQTKTNKHSTTNACTEQDRKKYIHDPNPEFITRLRACSRKTWANKKKNLACLHKTFPALSEPCATCFADMAKCSLNNCKLACAVNDKSEGCIKCANKNCQPDLIACTGVKRQDLP